MIRGLPGLGQGPPLPPRPPCQASELGPGSSHPPDVNKYKNRPTTWRFSGLDGNIFLLLICTIVLAYQVKYFTNNFSQINAIKDIPIPMPKMINA